MAYSELKDLFREHSILDDINGILNWDMATYMPERSRGQRMSQIKTIYSYKKKIFNLIKDKELFKKINKKELSSSDRLNFELMKTKFDYFDNIPFKNIQKKTLLSIECEGLWREARKKSNFNLIKKSLSKLVNVIKEESDILSQKKDLSKYDCLLLNYDRSINTNGLKKIFSKVEKFIKSNLKTIKKKQNKYEKIKPGDSLNEFEQFKLSNILMKNLGFDFTRGRIDKSLHPFCGGSTNDVRITTRFNSDDPFSCFDALMHETGHALYEQGLPKKWTHQPLGSAAGMSLHESQSLFVEMQLIKSLSVSKYLEQIIRKKLKKKSSFWNANNIFRMRNQVRSNNIRVDSDEVHYPLHIIHRFNIECQLIEKDENVESLPDLWNQEFKKIFGRTVDNDNDGCLQDIHWFGGDFGYFPTYSIGAFIAAQLKYRINKTLPEINKLLEQGKFKPVISWLKKNIHQKGSFYKIDQILEKCTGEKLKIKYFEKHIIDRYVNEIN